MMFSISEILGRADEAKSAPEKIEILQTFQNECLLKVLKCAFDPNIKFLLPEGPVDYRINRSHDSQSMLYSQAKKLYVYLEGESPPNLTQKRREALFEQFLSSLDAKDAELMVAVKDKKLPYKSITRLIVNKAFPGLLNNNG